MAIKNKAKKIFIILFSTIVILVALVIAFISPITKYLVEKYDEKYTGRKITLDWAYVNPFTGYIHFSNLKIYEAKSDSVFVSASGISANVSMNKLFSDDYEINDLIMDDLHGKVIQDQKQFNYDDLVKLFSSPGKKDTAKAPVHFNLNHLKVNDGIFYYVEKSIPVNYFIKKVNIDCGGYHWDSDSITGIYSFASGPGTGDLKGDFSLNIKNMDYRFSTIADKFDLQTFEQYLKQLSNYGSFTANLDANVKVKGNFNDKLNFALKGQVAVNDFHFGKTREEDYVSFDKIVMVAFEVNPGENIYLIDSVQLNHPRFKYEKYDHLDNVQNMFGRKGENIKAAKAEQNQKFNLILEIADYVKLLATNFLHSYYLVNRVAVYNGEIQFNDYSTRDKFSMSLKPFSIIADSLDKDHARVEFAFDSGIKPYGNTSIRLSMNPMNNEDFDLSFRMENIPVAMFNPYLVTYTSFPLDRGSIKLNSQWNVRNGNIKSTNHLVVIDPRVAKREKKKDTRWVPMPLVMAFIRERGNVIDYEIPISGDLKKPTFHWSGVITDLITNIFVKPPTTPYRIEVNQLENEIEKSLTLKWSMRQTKLLPGQEKFVRKMAEFLKDNKDANIAVHPIEYAEKEKENILLYEARKKYFLATHKNNGGFSEDDSLYVDKMSSKDSMFVHYLDKKVQDSMLFTVQEKCQRIVDENVVTNKFNQLVKAREQAFRKFFQENGTEDRVKILAVQHTIPYNGFSTYKIDYLGELPKSVMKAYDELDTLNNEPPRDKYKKEHRKFLDIFTKRDQ